jgi:hypothetical protein
MTKSGIYKLGLVALAALLMGGASQMQSRLNVERGQLGLTRLTPLRNAPPLVAFTTVALGGFRGLIANALCMRLNDLQLEDKFYEMVQLSDWITALEPHFAQVWAYQSWNMAFNVSVKFKDHEDRWHWVKRGMELLRDRGIPLNPDAALLYRELSWLFQFKIGQNLDDAHMLYKLRWAQEMQNVLGGRPDFQALEHPTTAAEKERARRLREIYKMDPKIIQKVDDEYGPFDWRLPDAHAVYWAELYRQKAKLGSTNDDSLWPTATSMEITNSFATDQLRRSIFQSLRQSCFRGGALSSSITNVNEQNFMLWPNLDLVPKINSAYEKMIAEQPTSDFQNAHKNFLKEAVALLYENGREKQATYWFDYAKKTYTNAFWGAQANFTPRDYALSVILDNYKDKDMNQIQDLLVGFYTKEFILLIRDNDAESVNYDNMAKDIWNNYHSIIAPSTGPRLRLKPWKVIRQRVLDELLDPKNPALTEYNKKYLCSKLGLPYPNTKATPPAPAPETLGAPAAPQ